MDKLILTRPDDWHLHVRDGDGLTDIVPWSARQFGRAIIMPNLKPPVTTTAAAREYRERIVAATPDDAEFSPLMTLYLTDNMPPREIEDAAASGIVYAVKLYPAGATTHSDSGVTNLARCRDTLAAMAEWDLPLLVHGEVTGAEVDIFDREARFLDAWLGPLLAEHPTLKVVLEHVTTATAVDFVRSGPNTLAATITAHHLLMNRNHLLSGGIRPHHYCLPVLKRESDREALIEAATSGSPRFFLGTDSAPHARAAKETRCGCAGVFSAPVAMPLYAEVFDRVGALDRLEGFASHFGPDFYGLPRNRDQLTLRRAHRVVENELPFGSSRVVPMRAGESVGWEVA